MIIDELMLAKPCNLEQNKNKICLAKNVAICLGAMTEFSKEAREIVILDVKILQFISDCF